MTRAGAGYLRSLRDDRAVCLDAERLVVDCLAGYDLDTEAPDGRSAATTADLRHLQ